MFYVVLIIICAILYYIYNNKQSGYWKKKNVNAEENWLLWKFLFGNRSLPEHLKEAYDAYDTLIGSFFGSVPTLIVKDLEDVQYVVAGDFQGFFQRGFEANESDILADNILFMEDYKRWKCIRQKLSPVFTTAKLKNMFYIMDRCAKDFVELLDSDRTMRDNPFRAIYTYTTASIGAAIFGIDTSSKKSTMESPFLEMAWSSVEPTFKANLKIFINSVTPRLFKLLNLKLFGDHEKFFVGVVRSVLESRRNSTEKRHDFIEICLELQKEGIIKDPQTGYEVIPSVEVLAAQAFFFFIAGADTSANTIHFTLLNLASHQDVLRKVHEEIDSVFEDKESLTYNDVEKLKYLDMAINESMRIYPAIGSLSRVAAKDTVLPGSKVRIDKGTSVIIPVFAIHRDARFHPEPNVYDPERFSPENAAQMPNYSFMPFGEGNRICIGNRFARLQVKAALSWMLRHYTLAEKIYEPKHFEKSAFALKDSKATYDLIRRNV